MEQFALSFVPERRIYTLRELSDGIREALERRFTNIWLAGEISTVKLVQSGHCYFVLKDADAQIKCVCWKLSYWRLKFKPKDGAQVVVRGRVDIYEGRSEYQFVVETIEPSGEGALLIAFEELKKRLMLEGLFDLSRKRALPKIPRHIGVVSSAKGAAIHDFVEVLSRRFPGIHIRLFPARVQGAGSIEDVCRGIEYFGRSAWAEIVVIARGGGSLEDLWTFNEEAVARAIAGCTIPVVSAIGHESDTTIADMVADLRAPTPSAAAEMVTGTRQELLERIRNVQQRCIQIMRFRTTRLARRLQDQAIDRATTLLNRSLARRLQRVDDLQERLRAAVRLRLVRYARSRGALEEQLRYFDLRPRLGMDRQRLNESYFQATTMMRAILNRRRQRLDNLTAKLSQLDPTLVLERGYSIVLDNEGRVVKDASAAPPGSDVKLRFCRSEAKARITE